MPSQGSVTCWLEPLRAGDDEAAHRLWQRYFRRLVGLARRCLHGAHCALGDEEDVALSAFASFCRAAEAGRFPRLADRDDLWRLLLTLTARKAFHLLRDEGAQKRGGRVVRLGQADSPEGTPLLEQVLSARPTPEMAAQAADECKRLLRSLMNDELREVAVLRMQGYTVDEIARLRTCSRDAIKRRLRVIRYVWAKEPQT
jgi:DNA-directed RNA polymerase specialized sigma24 family protein